MKGFLKGRSAGTQLLILISVALVSFFILGGLIGPLVLSRMAGINIVELADMSKWDYSKPGMIGFIRGMQVVQFISLFLIPSWLCAEFFSHHSKKYLGLKKPSTVLYFFMGVMVMILALPMVEGLGIFNRNLHFPAGIEHWLKTKEDEAGKTIQALLTRHTIKDLLLNVFFIAGLAAVGEELLFRGMLQRLLIHLFKNHWAGIIAAAFLFSAIHLQFYGFLPRFVLGIMLGVIYWYSGSLWTAMLAHFVYDASLIVVVYFSKGMINDESTFKMNNIALMSTVSLVFVVISVAWMIKRSTTNYQEVYAEDMEPVKDHPF